MYIYFINKITKLFDENKRFVKNEMTQQDYTYFIDPSSEYYVSLSAEESYTKNTLSGSKKNQSIKIPSIVLNAIYWGNPIENAARIAGISPSVIYHWIHTDPLFAEKIEQAKAAGQNVVIKKLWDSCMKGEPWGIKFWLQHNIDQYKDIQIKQEGISEETLKQIIGAITNSSELLPKEEENS